MIESFVDLTYRGLSLGRRVKLSQVRPTTGYLETPAPMPVGTQISIATDEGVTLEATVTAIHEQVGGSDRTPGMTVAPKLAAEASEGWWRARVALPDEVKPVVARTVSQQVTVRPRSHTIPQPPPEGVVIEPLERQPEPPDGRTVVMMAVEPEPQASTDVIPVLAELEVSAPMAEPDPAGGPRTTVMTAVDQDALEALMRKTGEHEVVDDGRATTVMDAVDPAALGLDLSASGSFTSISTDDDGGDDKKPSAGGAVKRRRKKR